MTEVFVEIDGNHLLLSAKGHATGSEIACAIVSAAVYGLAGTLRNAASLGMKVEVMTERLEPGDALIVCHGDGRAAAAFMQAYITLAQVARVLPEYIQTQCNFQ